MSTNKHAHNDMDAVARALVCEGGGGVDGGDGVGQLGVGGGGRGRPGGLAGELRLQYHLNGDKNEHNISKRGIIMHNVHVNTDIDGIDQAPVAHGGGGVDLVDGAARLEVGGRGRGRPGGLAGELRLQYHLNKNEHNISKRGVIVHNTHVTTDIDGVDQAEAPHRGVHTDLIDGAARLEVGGQGRGRPDGLVGGPRHRYHSSRDRNKNSISNGGENM